MTRSQLEYIIAIDKHRNFSKAAKACFITQSTLSAMVAKFEKQSGIILFDRKTKPISVTPQGVQLIKSIKNIYREYQLLDEKINEIKGHEFGNLSIACIPTVAPYLYPLILNTISQKFNTVNFTIHELPTKKIVDEILEGSVDIGIVSTPLEYKELLEYPLYHEDFLLYDCGKIIENPIYKVTDIDLERLWLMEEGHCLRNQVGKICELRQQKMINGNLIYSCGTIFTLIKMVTINKGVTLLPRLALANNTQIDKQFVHTLVEPIPTRQIGLITHKNFLKKRILQNLIHTIEKAVSPYLSIDTTETAVIKPF